MRLGLDLLAVASFAPVAPASPITVTFTGSAQGSLGGINFSYTPAVTITAVGDTSQVTTSAGVFTLPVTLASLSFGGSPATFTGATKLVVDQSAKTLILETSTGTSILGGSDNSFSSYTLATSFGPLTTTGFRFSAGTSFPTSAGGFILTGFLAESSLTITGTMTASSNPSPTPVPEPSTLAVFGGLAVAGLLGYRWRKAG